MHMDIDAIRQIMLAVKESDSYITEVEGMPRNVFNYNAMHLIEAGLVLGSIQESTRKDTQVKYYILIKHLTWQGLEFANSVADDTLWEKVKRNVLKPADSWTFEIIKDYIKHEIATNRLS